VDVLAHLEVYLGASKAREVVWASHFQAVRHGQEDLSPVEEGDALLEEEEGVLLEAAGV
jgi:hypothetical protein